jgi:hypothetical protein
VVFWAIILSSVSMPAGLQRTHEGDLDTDHLRHNRLAKPAGRDRDAAQTIQQFGAAAATTIGTSAAECLNMIRLRLKGGLTEPGDLVS